ncbi:MAG TPA: malonyl-CoA decarboxylase [Burkholderiaceae bacterium]|nr:malonyl-CoA decarboxylase [Burkholderiaceae bacterium]
MSSESPGLAVSDAALSRSSWTSDVIERFLRALSRGKRPAESPQLVEMAEALLSIRGEASGVALAAQLLEAYASADDTAKLAFLAQLVESFGPDTTLLDRRIEAYRADPSAQSAVALHAAAEPRRQELIRRMNLAPNGTVRLVRMREDVLRHQPAHPALAAVDADFVHLFSSWFNRGFLQLQRIDWMTPAEILERIIRYEAVHAISSWDDLRRRLAPPDRRCFAFFHPALQHDPLIFVEVALTAEIPQAIAPLLADERTPLDPTRATTAIFYSISTCHAGLRGVTFGSFLIKQVAEELSREFPSIENYATLSPIPRFVRWLRTQFGADGTSLLDPAAREQLQPLADPAFAADREVLETAKPALTRALLFYLFDAKDANGRPVDSVARFHLGNGAQLECIHWLADASEKGLSQSLGFMVSYRYELSQIERNHEAFASQGVIAAAAPLRRSLKAAQRLAAG